MGLEALQKPMIICHIVAGWRNAKIYEKVIENEPEMAYTWVGWTQNEEDKIL